MPQVPKRNDALSTAQRRHRSSRIILLVTAVVVLILAAYFWPRPPSFTNLVGHHKGVNDVAFSLDGQQIATGSDDGSIRIWSAAGQPLQVITGHSERVTVVRWSLDSSRIVSASGKGKMRIWDVQSGIEARALEGHTESVADMAISPAGNQLVSVGWDKMVKVWNIDTGKLVNSVAVPAVVECCAFTSDGGRILLGCQDNLVRIWDQKTSRFEEWVGHARPVKKMDLAKDGDTVVTASGWAVRLWSLRDAQLLHTFRHTTNVNSVAFFDDGRHVLAGGQDGVLLTYDVLARARTSRFKCDLNRVMSVASGVNGQLAAGGYPALACLWQNGRVPLEARVSAEPVPTESSGDGSGSASPGAFAQP